jgi:hypothetical protein
MEDLKNLAIVVAIGLAIWWWARKNGCSCGCSSSSSRPKQQSHPKAIDRRPMGAAGGVRAKPTEGCNPFACGR